MPLATTLPTPNGLRLEHYDVLRAIYHILPTLYTNSRTGTYFTDIATEC